MGFWSVFSLIVGAQLGTAMFLLPSQLAVYGLWGVLSFLLTGSAALVLSFVFAHLSKNTNPLETLGGPQAYIQKAFGAKIAFHSGWVYWVISWVSSLPVVILYGSSLQELFPEMSFSTKLILEISTLTLLMLLNMKGSLISGLGEIFFSVLKVLPLVAIPALSFFSAKGHPLDIPQNISALSALHQASLLGFWGYIGLECGTTVSHCVKNPEKIIPKALIFGSLLVTSVYFLNTWAVMRIVPFDILSKSINPYGVLLGILIGPQAGKIMSFMIALMCVGTLNSWLLASGQIAFISANQGFFPKFLKKTNASGSPFWGILLTGCLLILSTLLLHVANLNQVLNFLMTFSTAMFIVIYFLCTCTLLILVKQKKIPAKKHTFLLGVLAILFCLWALTGLEKEGFYMMFCIIGLGFLVHFFK